MTDYQLIQQVRSEISKRKPTTQVEILWDKVQTDYFNRMLKREAIRSGIYAVDGMKPVSDQDYDETIALLRRGYVR